MAPKKVRRTRAGEEGSAPIDSFTEEEGSNKSGKDGSILVTRDGFRVRLLARKILDGILGN